MDIALSFQNLSAAAHEAFSRADYRNAVDLFKKAIELQADHAHSWFMLGAGLDSCNLIPEAEHAFAMCEQLNPTHPEAANARGSILMKMNQIESALAAFDRAAQLNPTDPQIPTNIGIVLEALQRQPEALDKFNQALAIDPLHLGALNNRGALLLLQGRKEEALKDHLLFASLAPHSVTGHYFCAETLAALHRDVEALAASDAVLAIDPRHVKSMFSRAVSLSSLRRWEEAELAFDKGMQTQAVEFEKLLEGAGMDRRIWQKNVPNPRNIYCLRKQDQLRRCDWRDYDEFVATFRELLDYWYTSDAKDADNILAHPSLALPLTLQEHAHLAICAAASVPRSLSQTALTTSKQHQKLRIGYVSPDYRDHATTHLTRRIYGLHDRTTFDIYCYALYSDVTSPAIQKEIAAGCDVFRDVSALSVDTIDAMIRADEIDILIDLAGYTAHAKPELFVARPAPVCAAYLGYAGSTGLEGIDYYIGDAVTGSAEQAPYFSEKLVIMPRAGFCYNNLQTIAPPLTRVDYGLPPTGFVFCCLNNSWKLEPTVFDSWMLILHRVPDSVLWLYKPLPEVEKNLRAEAQQRGIDPTRLVFGGPIPVDQHLARYQVADLFLDTFYYGGHTTALDALWAGCPVLTKPGDHYASRVGASHLTALQMPELIVDSIAAYENLAVELASDRARLQQLRAKVAEKRTTTSLFDTADLVRNLERAYRAIWQRRMDGLEPAAIQL